MLTNIKLAAIGGAIYLAGAAALVASPARASIWDAIQAYPMEPAPPPVTCRIYGNAIYCG